MSQLSPELEELVLACKLAALPTDADSARILGALRVCLGDTVVFGSKPALAATTTFELLLGRPTAMGLAGLALLGGTWLLATDNHREALNTSNEMLRADVLGARATGVDRERSNISDSRLTIAARSSTSLRPSLEATTWSARNPEAENGNRTPRVDHVAERTAARSIARPRRRDTLGEEVALLSRAEAALGGSNPDKALNALNEHERRFGAGLLSEERLATRVQALCALGRSADADAQLAKLTPKSIYGHATPHACSERKGD